MGLETNAELIHDGKTVAVKALLESRELILRAPVKKTLLIADIASARVVDDALLFEHGGERFALSLPVGQAAKWLKKMTTEPPSLAQKLGVNATHPAMVYGSTVDSALADALKGTVTTDRATAKLGIAITETTDDLAAATDMLIHALPGLPLWVIYPKGAGSGLPESAVRAHMKALGYVDTKACAVSQRLTASRFLPRR